MSRLPDVGQRVGVLVQEWNARLVSQVAAVAGDGLTIAFPSDGKSDFDVPSGASVTLEWVTPRGLMRAAGRSAGHDGAGVGIRLTGDPEVFQRRDYVRANTAVEVVAKPLDGLTMPARGTSVDLSGGGVQVTLPGLGLDVDDRADLEIDLPEEDPIGAAARVTRRPSGDTYCFSFEHIDPKDQERLIKFVFQRLRGTSGKAA